MAWQQTVSLKCTLILQGLLGLTARPELLTSAACTPGGKPLRWLSAKLHGQYVVAELLQPFCPCTPVELVPRWLVKSPSVVSTLE